jgi:hypothetical protein
MAYHGHRPITVLTTEPVSTAIWPVMTFAYTDSDVPRVAVGTTMSTAAGRWYLICVS